MRFAHSGWAPALSARRRRHAFVLGVPGRYGAGLLALIALYYAAAKLGYALEFSGPVAAIVWLPVGVGITFLYLFGRRFWPGVVVGDLLVNNYSALPFGTALGQTFGNLLEVVVATVLLNRLVRDRSPLGTVRDVCRMSIALGVGTAISATIGSTSLLLGHVTGWASVPQIWRTWWLGDLSGALLVVPFAIAWYQFSDEGLVRRRRLEAVAALCTVAGLSALAMLSTHPRNAADYAVSAKLLGYLVFPALIWSAVRLRQRGATLAVALAAGIAVWATTHYVGPFSSHSLEASVLQTQLFIVIAAFTTLCLAAAVVEREALAKRLTASRSRLVNAADTERRRLEHNLHDGAQQLLTGLMVRLSLAAKQARGAPIEAEAMIEAAREELGLAIEELRQLARGDHPAVLTRQGLGAAIATIAERSHVPIEVVESPTRRLSDRAEATAYYVLAEAVANAQKYAHASAISLRAGIQRGFLYLSVADDGVGGAEERPGSGLEGLRDRVEAVGGVFNVESRVGRGTVVGAVIPLAGPSA